MEVLCMKIYNKQIWEANVPCKNPHWRKGVWNKKDFKKIKTLLKKYKGEAFLGENYTCFYANRVAILHFRLDTEESYGKIKEMMEEIRGFKYDFIPGSKAVLSEVDKFYLDLYFKEFDFDDLDKVFIMSTGDFDYLLGSDFYNIKKCKL